MTIFCQRLSGNNLHRLNVQYVLALGWYASLYYHEEFVAITFHLTSVNLP
jgi:hypothetical protein